MKTLWHIDAGAPSGALGAGLSHLKNVFPYVFKQGALSSNALSGMPEVNSGLFTWRQAMPKAWLVSLISEKMLHMPYSLQSKNFIFTDA